MKLLALLPLVGLIVCSIHVDAISIKKTPFSDLTRYSVSGIIRLPYAEVDEPFRVWFDVEQSASRIDYYDGMVSTLQLAPTSDNSYGTGIKVIPFTDEVQTNVRSCFWVNGTKETPLTLQSVIPDTTSFTFIGESSWKGLSADQWESVVVEGGRTNTYSFYINAKTGEPLYYEMIGYDSLLGSHYDRYYVEYFNFKTDEIAPSVFSLPSGLKCRSFPGPGDQVNRVSVNPMREFFHNDETHVHAEFNHFKDKHSKSYATEIEHKERLHTFRHNLRYINSINRKGLSYRLAVNHLADKSDEELRILRGKQKTNPNAKNNGLPFTMMTKEKLAAVPSSFDWRLYGAVTPVKDQGICGSCWAFGTVEAIEGAYFVKHNQQVILSPQNLIDCTWGFGNNGCDGGEDFRAYDWIKKHGGIATSESYGGYLQADAYCHFNQAKVGAQITGYVNVTIYDANALKVALVNQGPISIAIDAGHKSMVFYANGVYYEPTCGNKPENLDHAVLLVGYGNINGEDYWLVKNSWSNYWGNDGYILMSQKDNNCGVTTSPTYPIVV